MRWDVNHKLRNYLKRFSSFLVDLVVVVVVMFGIFLRCEGMIGDDENSSFGFAFF